MIRTVYWENEAVVLLDQRKLPVAIGGSLPLLVCRNYHQVIQAIKTLAVRGAPAIGVAAALGIALGMRKVTRDRVALHQRFAKIATEFSHSRPTAVNLFWAIKQMKSAFLQATAADFSSARISQRLLEVALELVDNDIKTNIALGEHGQALIDDGDAILTHCNAGALACAGYGTALGVLRSARQKGKNFSLFIDETRPVLQGARLTAWEMQYEKIPATLICDSMAGSLMASGRVNKIITGADRIAANGDVANKIGTYSLAVLAKAHKIPFYVAAPLATFDLSIDNGCDIPIEERAPEEVTHIGVKRIAPKGISVFNPAFDVTPARLITAIITERGIIKRPGKKSIRALLVRDEGKR
ncbi:MAG: S-methyl-5-thioribose-1-phosphate isomerase [Deltaproteobacteria bacterium]|nr:S-methyl-5-thioribose-1-phosphate isomerase [Deltaproteobacteria bacterium]